MGIHVIRSTTAPSALPTLAQLGVHWVKTSVPMGHWLAVDTTDIGWLDLLNLSSGEGGGTGSGDMLKQIYDENNDNIVDKAASLVLSAYYQTGVVKGDPVYVTGINDTEIMVSKANAESKNTLHVIGVATADHNGGETGLVQLYGALSGLDTNGLDVGDPVYVANGGGITTTPPTYRQQVGTVLRVGGSDGVIGVNPQPVLPDTLVADSIAGAGMAGTNKYYGTNAIGAVGFHAIPSGGGDSSGSSKSIPSIVTPYNTWTNLNTTVDSLLAAGIVDGTQAASIVACFSLILIDSAGPVSAASVPFTQSGAGVDGTAHIAIYDMDPTTGLPLNRIAYQTETFTAIDTSVVLSFDTLLTVEPGYYWVWHDVPEGASLFGVTPLYTNKFGMFNSFTSYAATGVEPPLVVDSADLYQGLATRLPVVQLLAGPWGTPS